MSALGMVAVYAAAQVYELSRAPEADIAVLKRPTLYYNNGGYKYGDIMRERCTE